MKRYVILSLTVLVICSCTGGGSHRGRNRFVVEVMRRTTPVKDQGSSSSCWAYAMLSMIESEHLSQGDSVNLSEAYIERRRQEDEFSRLYFSSRHRAVVTRGTGKTLLNALQRYGAYPYDSYPGIQDNNEDEVTRRMENLAMRHPSYSRAKMLLSDILDSSYGPLPRNVYMLGAEYTPLEFAHSVCRKDEYSALTSYTHHPFGVRFDLEIPDNWEHDLYINMPIDRLEGYVLKSLRTGHSAVWEGDISNHGFSFRGGVAKLVDSERVTQSMRQHEFESLGVTDDHAMHIVGLAHDGNGERYFILKNSWGTGNVYGGYMFMSEGYFRLNTVMVFLPSVVIKDYKI